MKEVVGKDVVREEVWGNVVEEVGLWECKVVCKGEALKGFRGVLFASAGEFALSSEKCLV